MKFLAVPALLLPLIASAGPAVPLISDADREHMRPMSEQHRACMASKAAELGGSSDDIPALVEQIAVICDPLLTPMKPYLVSQGFSASFAEIYFETVRGQHGRRTSTSLQRRKNAAHP